MGADAAGWRAGIIGRELANQDERKFSFLPLFYLLL
jgi:hypothetical protein